MNGKKKKNLILALVIVLIAAALLALPALLRAPKESEAEGLSYLSARVERGNVRTTISGGGTITDPEGSVISVPKGVEITEYLVSNGDAVEEGQLLAVTDPNSVLRTIATVQENLDYLSRKLQRTSTNDAAVKFITTPAAGRVKAVYAQVGDEAKEIMETHGALAVISLDGLMVTTVRTDAELAVGTAVTVILSDGTEKQGRIEHRRDGELTVTLPDDKGAIGETVSVLAPDSAELGTGELAVHSALNITATDGLVDYVYVKEGAAVGANYRLFRARDVDDTVEFRTLSILRRDYEQTMLKLFEIYSSGGLTAPADGCVSGIDTTRVGQMSADGKRPQLLFLSASSGDPAPTPTPDINSTPAGQLKNKYAMVSTVTFGSITFMVQDDSAPATDYKSQPAINYGALHEETFTSFAGVTIYEYDTNAGRWAVIHAAALREGDVLYFVYDSADKLIWIIRPQQSSGGDAGGYVGGGGGGGEAPFTMYDLTETELMSVIPQDRVTVAVSVDEMDILSVYPGQSAEITLDALPGRMFEGTVTQIDPVGKNSGGSTRYTVTVSIERLDGMLGGMNATAIMTVGVTEDVLTIPVAALDQKGTQTIVYTGFDAETHTLLDPVVITTGVSDSDTVEVTSGLNEGETVWYAYYGSQGAIPWKIPPETAEA